jgi:nitrosocyanin
MKKTILALLISGLFTPAAFSANEPAKMDNMNHDTMMASEKGVRVIHVVTESINEKTRYSPAVFIVKKGEKVRFKIYNATEKVHGFSIDAFNIKGTLEPKDNIIEFTANKEGLFEVYCQFHPAHLTAQLLVVK